MRNNCSSCRFRFIVKNGIFAKSMNKTSEEAPIKPHNQKSVARDPNSTTPQIQFYATIHSETEQ